MGSLKGEVGRVDGGQVEGDDGWSIIPRSKKGKRANVSEQVVRPTRAVPNLTIEKLVGELGGMEAQWKRTLCAKNLEKMLSLSDWTVREAVCIGIGSFSIDWAHRYRSMWQLILFRAVVKLLQKHEATIALYAQEPAFTSLDISFLEALDIAVLPSNVENHITPLSFVFAPFVDWYLLLPLFLKGKDPELYIGNEILPDYKTYANTQEKERMLPQCNELGRIFAERRERRRIPEFELHAHALNGLMVYWKEDEDE